MELSCDEVHLAHEAIDVLCGSPCSLGHCPRPRPKPTAKPPPASGRGSFRAKTETVDEASCSACILDSSVSLALDDDDHVAALASLFHISMCFGDLLECVATVYDGPQRSRFK